MQKYDLAQTWLLASLLLFGCSPPQQTPSKITLPVPLKSTPMANECITPLSNLAMPIGAEIPKPIRDQVPIPPIDWDLITTLPDPASNSVYTFVAQNSNSVWVEYNKSNVGEVFARYSLSNDHWSFFSTTSGLDDYAPAKLFWVNNDLWGAHVFSGGNAGTPLLIRFNQSKNMFEPIVDSDGLLQFPNEIRSDVAVDHNSVLWMFVKIVDSSELKLFSLNTDTLQLKEHSLNSKEDTASLLLMNDGKLLTIDRLKGSVIQYDPASKEILPIDILIKTNPNIDPPFTKFDGLSKIAGNPYFDHSNRLWLGFNGWLDMADLNNIGWYKILTPPQFVNYNEYYQSYMIPPFSTVYQSSNGWIWFSSAAGIVRLKMEDEYSKGDWCLITTGQSDVMEDNAQNLWMIVFNKIYRYSLDR